MATSDNYLIWNAGNLHSNFKEGDTIEDKKA